jgi:IPT/TIG domain-containing protein
MVTTAPPDAPAVEAQPVLMVDAFVQLGDGNLSCLATSVSLEPEDNPITVTTFCGVKEYPGPVKWHFRARILQSFEPGATFETLKKALDGWAAASTPVVYKVRAYKSRPVAEDNPEFFGEAVPKPFVYFGGDAGNPSEVELDWIMTEEPQINTALAGTPPLVLTSITPSTCVGDTPTLVTLSGSGFDVGSLPSVEFGAIPGSGTAVVDDTQITTTTPSGMAAGAVDVILTVGPGRTQTLAAGFTFT